ncbi:telomere repeat binding factor family protein [Aspergillus lucknowensis]|uniref:MYB DNA-binding domain protein n=1 Tax=Aspergillus lucknowensis TaxID=176173 RepID=A0ABR4LVA8_9EURO
MDPKGIFARSLDESLIRELPHFRIAPLREPVPSRSLRTPSTLEPNASGAREASAISKPAASAVILPARHEPGGAAFDGGNVSRLKKSDLSADSLLEPPPKPILPAFVNLRALERFPYSSFDDDGLHSRKRRRVDIQSDTFGEHLQLPIPQAQKEQRPPPFGPFAILNGLNEPPPPPPNAALLPPIEPGSITQLLTKPSRDSSAVEPALLATTPNRDAQSVERREGRIADILDSPVAKKPNPNLSGLDHGKANNSESEQALGTLEKELQVAGGPDEPLSPQTRGRSRKNLRKWTDEETITLLRGVVKCGIGNWKEILAQPELNFNKRSASNLKDRFRVCCPWAYRASNPTEALSHLRDALSKALLRAESELSAKSYIPQPVSADPESSFSTEIPSLTPSGSSSSFSSIEASQTSREHNPSGGSMAESTPTVSNLSKSTVESLNISEQQPLAKGRRRSRRPFTPAEDEALLKGYAVHGFQWTLIQQDRRLNLGHRRATDLRDRFRTKFPRAYRDGGSVSGKTLQAQMKDPTTKDGAGGIPGSKQSKRTSSSDRRPEKPDGRMTSTSGTVDSVFPSPVPPQAIRESSSCAPPPGLPFPLDENSANPAGVDLPPLVWDDLP